VHATLFEASPRLAALEDPTCPAIPVCDEPSDDFARLVAIYRQNEQLLARAARIRAAIAEALRYARSPGANAALARARLGQLRARHAVTRVLLRSYRVEANALLCRHGHVDARHDEPCAA
jgi:hypothetical protein